MKILIIEDERLLVNELIALIAKLGTDYEVVGSTPGIRSSVKWLQTNEAPDLILMDIELADGQSFEIFKEVEVHSPVIFTTAFDEFALKAFKVNSVDYLLKPILEKDLLAALKKLERLQQPAFANREIYVSLINELKKSNAEKEYRKRFLVKSGITFLTIEDRSIAFFSARNTLNYLMLFTRKEYLVEQSLDELESMVDPGLFFRANRQYLLTHNSISAVHPWFNGKLKVTLSQAPEAEVIVSRERAGAFKTWLGS